MYPLLVTVGWGARRILKVWTKSGKKKYADTMVVLPFLQFFMFEHEHVKHEWSTLIYDVTLIISWKFAKGEFGVEVLF